MLAVPAFCGEPANHASISLQEFRKIPILEEGRIKPMETYAQTVLLQFSGRWSFNKLSAVEWLAKLLFTPEATHKDKVFLVNNPEVALAIGIIPEEKRRYSFAQLEPGFTKLDTLAMSADQIEEKKRSLVESELLRLYGNLRLYMDLSQAFQFAVPAEDFAVTNSEVRAKLKLPQSSGEFSFIDIASRADGLQTVADSLQNKPQEKWSQFEKDTFSLLNNLYQWSMHFRGMRFHMIAPIKENEVVWLSPWDAMAEEFQNDPIRGELIALGEMAKSFVANDQKEFDGANARYLQSLGSRTGNIRALKFLPLELIYNSLKPFAYSQFFYFLALVLTFWSLFSTRTIIYRLAFAFVVLGFLPHLAGIVVRILILYRPPVSSLYETFIYVGFLTVVIGIIVELSNRQRIGMLVSSICGTILLMIAGKFSAEGDTMKMLVAVLNSNFWLTIHVLHITAGYAICCAAGVLAHVFLIQAVVKPKDRAALEKTFRYVFIVLGFGLTLTLFGTAMGGIWADQSWGRFWGWDPKENGALLIVLWCAIMFHLRITRLIGPVGFAVGSALVIPVVMWAWFGVNLLGVGLHSYGFTQGIAINLTIYYVSEMAFVLGVLLLIRIRNPQLGT